MSPRSDPIQFQERLKAHSSGVASRGPPLLPFNAKRSSVREGGFSPEVSQSCHNAATTCVIHESHTTTPEPGSRSGSFPKRSSLRYTAALGGLAAF